MNLISRGSTRHPDLPRTRRALLPLTASAVLAALPVTPAGAAKQCRPTRTRSFVKTDSRTITIAPSQMTEVELQVRGIKGGKVLDVEVVLAGFEHPDPMALTIHLVGPGELTTILMANVGLGNAGNLVTLHFDTQAPREIIPGRPLNDAIPSGGRVRTTDHSVITTSLNPDLTKHNGKQANGTWRLRMHDGRGGGTNGRIQDGWQLRLQVSERK